MRKSYVARSDTPAPISDRRYIVAIILTTVQISLSTGTGKQAALAKEHNMNSSTA